MLLSTTDGHLIFGDGQKVYLLTPRGRVVICGYGLDSTDPICLSPAGDETNHPGEGFCRIHDPAFRGVFRRLAQEVQDVEPKTFAESLTSADELTDSSLINPMELLKGLYGMMMYYFQRSLIDADEAPDPALLPHIRGLMRDVRTLQKEIIDHRTSYLELVNIASLVDTIFVSIQRHTDDVTAKLIFDDLSEAISPITEALHPTQQSLPIAARRMLDA